MKPRTLASLALATLFNVRLMGDEEADGVINDLVSKITKGLVCDPDNVQPEEGGGGFYAHYLGNWYGDLDDPRPRLSKLDTPVLVLQGQCDIFPYAGTYEFADIFPNGEYRFIEGAGHEIWWDKPDVFVEEIRRFLVPRATEDEPGQPASSKLKIMNDFQWADLAVSFPDQRSRNSREP